MTTNVFCKKKNVLASDSRWSFRIDDKLSTTLVIAYVDDTGYDKIALDEDTGFIFAGPGHAIDRWRTWALSPNQALLPRPPVETDFAICMTDLESGDILMEHGQKISDEFCRTAGTGAFPAYECWKVNFDAKTAVESAKKVDLSSGGDVKFLSCGDRKHNLSFAASFDSIAAQFLHKGMVMYPASSHNAVPIAQAANDDPRVASLVSKVKSGQASAEAPSGLDPVVWTPADEARLDEALAARAARRAARKANQQP